MTYVCPHCGAISHNPNDYENRYCAACAQFEEDDPRPPRPDVEPPELPMWVAVLGFVMIFLAIWLLLPRPA